MKLKRAWPAKKLKILEYSGMLDAWIQQSAGPLAGPDEHTGHIYECQKMCFYQLRALSRRLGQCRRVIGWTYCDDSALRLCEELHSLSKNKLCIRDIFICLKMPRKYEKKGVRVTYDPARMAEAAAACSPNTMGMSRLEVNLRRLLSQCENLAKEGHQKDWRLDKVSEDNLRHRKEKGSGEDLDVLLKYHHSMREKIADNMLLMVRNLKEQSQLASTIIKKDVETVQKSSKQSDQNFDRLKGASDRLAEHSRRAWKCWMWIMIALVMIIFINMVLFMKVMKKKL
uniref:Vesicle transport protein USE1 n=1 Tax=Timema poppense TaxID=170557 RepID=A0A7R9H139_TIMPO|nr:unnamed protein product [Timema poppensis]